MLITDRRRNSERMVARVRYGKGVTPKYLLETGLAVPFRSKGKEVTSVARGD